MNMLELRGELKCDDITYVHYIVLCEYNIISRKNIVHNNVYNILYGKAENI